MTMKNFHKHSVSLTKNGFFKVYKIIEHFPPNEILSNLGGTYEGIKLDKAQVMKILSVDPRTEVVPEIWGRVRTMGTQNIKSLTFIAILFSHHKLIERFGKSTCDQMRGTIFRKFFGEKEYTNLIDSMEKAGLCKKSIGAEKTHYCLEPLFDDKLGPLVKELLILKLQSIGWEQPKDEEFCRGFYNQCFYYNFHGALGITKEQFKNWLEDGKFNALPPSRQAIIIEDAGKEYEHKNILFKGVPGTGKSRVIHKIIENEINLDMGKYSENIMHINIHSASSNADLMQGIGIGTQNDQIVYHEKQGLIYEHIRKACYSPNQPFVLILEEIQENSLNELIGDLIYLIEPSKRMPIATLLDHVDTDRCYAYVGDDNLIEAYINAARKVSIPVHSVKIPFLVETSTKYREMILPDNLYIFCTSNYREDKKVIEDNLLRRFDVVELYPQYEENYEDKSGSISLFLKTLNKTIQTVLEDEIHPDRFQIGHGNWIAIQEGEIKNFYQSLLKVVIEFKEIREIESKQLFTIFSKTAEVLEETSWIREPFMLAVKEFGEDNPSYADIVNFLQKNVYEDILALSKK